MTKRIITTLLLLLTILPLYAQVDKQSKGYIKQRIVNIYNYDLGDREFFFCSKDYYALYKQVVKKDEALVGGNRLLLIRPLASSARFRGADVICPMRYNTFPGTSNGKGLHQGFGGRAAYNFPIGVRKQRLVHR